MEKKDKSTIGVIPPSEIAKILAKKGIDINNVAVHDFAECLKTAHSKELQITNPKNIQIKKF